MPLVRVRGRPFDALVGQRDRGGVAFEVESSATNCPAVELSRELCNEYGAVPKDRLSAFSRLPCLSGRYLTLSHWSHLAPSFMPVFPPWRLLWPAAAICFALSVATTGERSLAGSAQAISA